MLLVGVTTHTDDFSQLTESELAYITMLKRCGMTPVLLENTADFEEVQAQLDRLDGLVLIGGGDVHPCHYGRTVEEGVDYMDFDKDRDLYELQLARDAHAMDMPTLGICRGNQIMNVALGGTLHADLAVDGKTDENHHQTEPYNIAHQTVHIQPETQLFDLLFGSEARYIDDIDWVLNTNSMHHQAIEHPAHGLRINAITTDGVYEGIEDPKNNFYIGVQWHPEYLDNCTPLFEGLRDACRRS